MTPRSAAERGPRTRPDPDRIREIVAEYELDRDETNEENALRRLATALAWAEIVAGATAAVPLDVERLALAFDNLHLELVYVGPGYLLDPIPDLIAAEYARLSADEEGGTP